MKSYSDDLPNITREQMDRNLANTEQAIKKIEENLILLNRIKWLVMSTNIIAFLILITTAVILFLK